MPDGKASAEEEKSAPPDEEELTRLKRSRAGHRGHVTKLIGRVEDYLSPVKSDEEVNSNAVAAVAATHDLLKEKLRVLRNIDARILALLKSDARAHEDEVLDIDDFGLEAELGLSNMQHFLSQHARTATASTPASGSSSRIKLPELKLPTFSGLYTQWTAFIDLFNASVDSNSSLCDSEKLHYLKSSLEGEASKLVSSLASTDDNYKIARKLLEDRYDNKRAIIRAHVHAICSYTPIKTENAVQLRRIQSVMNEHIHALSAQGVDEPNMTVYAIVEKLDPETRKSWELEQSSTSSADLKELLEFLDKRARALEVGPAVKSADSANNRNLPSSFSNQNKRQFVGVTANKCPQCNDPNHKLFRCPQFTALSADQRHAQAMKFRVCFNCLQHGHQKPDCPSQSSCKTCNQRHNTLLHKPAPEPAGQEPKKTDLFFGDSSSLQTVLGTVQISILDKHGNRQQFRALLDSGSTAHVMSSHTMQRLGLKARRSSSSLCGISGTVLAQTTGEIDATLYCDFSDRYFPATFLVTRSITGKMPPQKLPTDDMSIIDQVHMADPNFAIPNDIDLLIGADLFDVICLTGRVQLQPRLYLRETLDGFFLALWNPGQERHRSSHSLIDRSHRCTRVYMPLDLHLSSSQFVPRMNVLLTSSTRVSRSSGRWKASL